MKLIHTADWQLGKPYGRFEPEVRAALTEARFDAIGKVATLHAADHVLVAGDVFDTEGPEDRTIVQAISRMERHPCRWWLLPGNHDFARNGGLREIHSRHFVETALAAGLSLQATREIIDDVRSQTATAFEEVANTLPQLFPEAIHQSVLAAAQARLRVLDHLEAV
jgi:DNA repair exonuclease SbcCD nuclease subunit